MIFYLNITLNILQVYIKSLHKSGLNFESLKYLEICEIEEFERGRIQRSIAGDVEIAQPCLRAHSYHTRNKHTLSNAP